MEECTKSRYCVEPRSRMGAKSLIVSNGRFVYKLGLTTRAELCPHSSVQPSGKDRATISAPILPAAPGRLSTMTCRPPISVNFGATVRASESAPPPGGNVTIIRIDLLGQFWAKTPLQKIIRPNSAAVRLTRYV